MAQHGKTVRRFGGNRRDLGVGLRRPGKIAQLARCEVAHDDARLAALLPDVSHASAMPRPLRPHIAAGRARLALAAALLVTIGACSTAVSGTGRRTSPRPSARPSADPSTSPHPTRSTATTAQGEFSFAFAGDVHFEDRTADRLAHPATAFGEAKPVLAAADLTMVNLETAITTRGEPAPKEFHFRAPAAAFTALHDAGVDVATMANNHAADYGAVGLRDTLAAIRASRFPVVGIGANTGEAYAAWQTSVNGVQVAVIAASQVRDETLANYTAGPDSPGIASADSDALLQSVRAAKAAGYVVVVYLHWGIEYTSCPDADQRGLADALAHAGAAAIIGAHVHQLQGAGWRPDGAFVAYGLGNYLWWRSFGNAQDDNGVLTLRFRSGRVVAEHFAPAHLDDRGVPLPATGSEAARIDAEWEQVRQCADLAADPPR